jgi:hypothetical protein
MAFRTPGHPPRSGYHSHEPPTALAASVRLRVQRPRADGQREVSRVGFAPTLDRFRWEVPRLAVIGSSWLGGLQWSVRHDGVLACPGGCRVGWSRPRWVGICRWSTGRLPGTGGRCDDRAVEVEASATVRARRVRPRRVEGCRVLRDTVSAGLARRWCPQQIAARLRVDLRDDKVMRWSHEAIDQACGWSCTAPDRHQPAGRR